MRLHPTERSKTSAPAAHGKPALPELSPSKPSIATAPLKRAPSQKELATVFGVTTRHLRRWEQAEQDAGSPCSRPYSAVDLWRLYQRRYPKKWDRTEATRLQIAPLFEQFDTMLGRGAGACHCGEQATLTALMLKSLAWDGDTSPSGTLALPQPLRANLARASKEQLRDILECAPARDVLVRAYFEAALLAEGTQTRPAATALALSA